MYCNTFPGGTHPSQTLDTFLDNQTFDLRYGDVNQAGERSERPLKGVVDFTAIMGLGIR